MALVVLGVSHRTAPIEVRERFVFSRADALVALSLLRAAGAAREGVLLSTCNRTELYLCLAPGRDGLALAERIFEDRAGPLPRVAGEYVYRREEDEAVRQLFRVASGLDSMVLGEAEIQGQVREAYESAAAAPVEPPFAGPVLSRLFQAALAVGGRVRNETELGRGAASVPSVAVELARKIFGALRGRGVLVLGAGDMAALAVQALAREGVRGVVVANRSPERARALAGRLGGRAIRFDDLTVALGDADIVVSSTAAPHPVLTVDKVRRAFPQGPARPLFVIDIAVPRDVEAEVGAERNVFLYNIDDLQQIVDDNIGRRREAIPAAEGIVAEGAEEFWSWYSSLEVVPVIRSLRERAERIRREELERMLGRLGHLDPEDRAAVEDLTRRLLNKLLHAPTVQLREGAANGRGAALVDAARRLFDLDSDGS
ncbi:MAG: glutamyl-tRNA reductase [Gemmatimonadetes bacterium]|nr:glutamyl-tRNA reductase [Gemmatimonadota bacterium]